MGCSFSALSKHGLNMLKAISLRPQAVFLLPIVALCLQACVGSGVDKKVRVTSSSTSSACGQACEVYFERMQRAVGRDITGHKDIGIVQRLIKEGLRQDYEGQLVELNNVRATEATVSEVVRLAQEAHSLMPAVRTWLLKEVKNANWRVRRGAVHGLVAIVKTAPQLDNGQACDMLLKAVADSVSDVCSAAASALGELVKVAPQYAKEALEALLNAAVDSESYGSYKVRAAAASALGELVKVAPQHAKVAYDVLLRAKEDTGNDWRGIVRRAAASALKEVEKVMNGASANPSQRLCAGDGGR